MARKILYLLTYLTCSLKRCTLFSGVLPFCSLETLSESESVLYTIISLNNYKPIYFFIYVLQCRWCNYVMQSCACRQLLNSRRNEHSNSMENKSHSYHSGMYLPGLVVPLLKINLSWMISCNTLSNGISTCKVM